MGKIPEFGLNGTRKGSRRSIPGFRMPGRAFPPGRRVALAGTAENRHRSGTNAASMPVPPTSAFDPVPRRRRHPRGPAQRLFPVNLQTIRPAGTDRLLSAAEPHPACEHGSRHRPTARTAAFRWPRLGQVGRAVEHPFPPPRTNTHLPRFRCCRATFSRNLWAQSTLQNT